METKIEKETQTETKREKEGRQTDREAALWLAVASQKKVFIYADAFDWVCAFTRNII